MKARTWTLAAMLGCCMATTAHAGCIVADPTPTPLNVRTAPNGAILGTVTNGQAVRILDSTSDQQGRLWVYVGNAESPYTPFGWVFREFIVCKGEAR